MFSKIILDNYASFDHFEFDLIENKTDKKAKKMAIVYGENGIGKTSLIRAIEILQKTYVALVATEEVSKLISQYNQQDLFFTIFNTSISSFRIASIIEKCRKIGAKENTKLTYELLIAKKRYIYSMSFGDTSIDEEKLLCDGIVLFKAKKHKLSMSDMHFVDEPMKEKLRGLFSMYYGDKYTFLSCIFSLRKSVTKQYFSDAMSQELTAFLTALDKVTVVTKDPFNAEINNLGINSSSDVFLPNLVSGKYSEDLKSKKEKTEMALTMFFSSLYSNIISAHYVIETSPQGIQQYSLHFLEKAGDDIVDIPSSLESTGTNRLIGLFNYIYKAATDDGAIFIDEIDEGINDILLRDIFNSIDNSLTGQFVVTTHNTLLLKASLKKNIYLLNRDQNNNVVSYSLDEFGRKIQPATDVVGQYLNGLYGGVPQSGSFSIDYIVKALKDYE